MNGSSLILPGASVDPSINRFIDAVIVPALLDRLTRGQPSKKAA
jgi:hypothetical protein